ncbi:MAG TPA: DUF4349 domain-containing protein [Thermoanaerobaculia bacterium]|nr:DUF4349 domain-containing protein [Thermoanaerobaculia bacterium]
MRPTSRVEVIVKKIIALLFVLLSLSCSRQEKAASNVTDTALPANASVARVKTQGAAPAAGVTPMMVRTAQMRIVVADTMETVDAVTRSVEAIGGFVAGSNIWRDGELMRATLTLRVPSDKLTGTLASIRGLAKRVDNENITSEDVSQEYVDLQSHVRNLEATETELLALLTVARERSKRASEVLEVHQQVMTIRGQIEQAKGRLSYLSQVSAMSSISLEVMPDAIAQPVVEPGGWQALVVVKDAVRALVGSLQSIATIAIWLFIYIVPIFGMIALVIVAALTIARRVRARQV